MKVRTALERKTSRLARKKRIRKVIIGTPNRPRMVVFRSAKHISVQVIDDSKGHTLASATSEGKEFREVAGHLKKIEKAREVGRRIAQICKQKGIESVVFDRNGFLYHGRVKAVAEAAREGGLKF